MEIERKCKRVIGKDGNDGRSVCRFDGSFWGRSLFGSVVQNFAVRIYRYRWNISNVRVTSAFQTSARRRFARNSGLDFVTTATPDVAFGAKAFCSSGNRFPSATDPEKRPGLFFSSSPRPGPVDVLKLSRKFGQRAGRSRPTSAHGRRGNVFLRKQNGSRSNLYVVPYGCSSKHAVDYEYSRA